MVKTEQNRHWAQFADFVQWERAVGGPDPHMVLVGAMSTTCSWEERVWRGGCYVGVYNVPTAEALWKAWPWPTVRDVSIPQLESWLREHWLGIATRRERRCVRRPEQLAQYLKSFATWSEKASASLRKMPYEEVWRDAQGAIYALGRYSAIKLLEYGHRYCEWATAAPDIRAKGGQSPREALCLLFPERAEAIGGDDRASHVAIAEQAAQEIRQYLAEDRHLAIDNFLTQVLLCDYKQSWKGGRQYPGRSHDSELQYAAYVDAHFGPCSDMPAARKRLFPARALGEIAGWPGVRKELGGVLSKYGYTWSDLQYDYLNTANLGMPHRWES